MPSRTTWSWADVQPEEPAPRRLTVVLDAETHGQLAAIADEAGQTVAAIVASIIRDVVADDAAAHGRED